MKHIFLVLLLFIQGFALPSLAAPVVTVSIKPLYSLVKPIMQGVSKPILLLDSHQSAHHQHFTPGQLVQLNRSDIIIRISPYMETSIQNAISVQQQKKVMTLIELPGIYLLPASKNNGLCNPSKAGSCNPHIWLNTENLHIFINSISKKLAISDPTNSDTYISNAVQLNETITKTVFQIAKDMEKLKNTRILALHNSWQYFAKDFGLSGYQYVVGGDFNQLGARSVLKWKRMISNGEIDCILADPDNNRKSIQSLSNLNTKVILVNANPMGLDINSNVNTSITDYLKYVANLFSQCHKP